MNDLELLRLYSRQGSQTAFTDLVSQHVGMVYSAARRQARSPELAEEITQAVFLDLARNAGRLRPDSRLVSWLFVVTRRKSIDAIRRESRRQKREQAALAGAALASSASPRSQVEPLLDEAISSLGEIDRSSVLLRFFEGKSFVEIGRNLGASEEAAQKRVSRAVDRLRAYLAKRGVVASTATLAAEFLPHAVQAAPGGLAASISKAVALAQPAAAQIAVLHSTHTLAMTFLQKAAITTAVAIAVAGGLYQDSVIRRQARQLAALELRTDSWQQQVVQLKRERTAAADRLAALLKENQNLRNGAEQASRDPTDAALRSWLMRVNQLKQRIDDRPALRIPELQYATDRDWLDAAKANLDTEEDFRRALGRLRNAAVNAFGAVLQSALKKYLQNNAGQFPGDLSQLQPYFDGPVDPAVLDRYQIVPAIALPNMILGGGQIVTQKSVVDDDYDATIAIGPRGSATSWGESNSLLDLVKAFAAANSGQPPSDLAQMLPYAVTPAQQAALHRAIQSSGGK